MIRADDTQVVVVWTTFPGDGDPTLLSQALVSERLAACVTMQPGLRSVYRWAEDVVEATEYQLMIKTTVDRVERLERRVGELHPYDVPEFLVLSVESGSASYAEWVRASTRHPQESD